MEISDLPTLNASLNGLAAMFLVAGYLMIRSGRRDAHRRCMLTALGTSALLLIVPLASEKSSMRALTGFRSASWFT